MVRIVVGALCAGSIGGLAVFVACTPKASGNDVAPQDGGLGEAQTSSTTASACVHQGVPARPHGVIDAGGTLDLVFAVQQNCYGQRTTDDAGNVAYEDAGFDLDDTCTDEGQGSSCVEPASATASHRDGVNGIDNAYVRWAIAGGGIKSTTDDCMTIADTDVVVLYRIRGYSGDPNDDQVEVAQYFGYGLSPRPDRDSGALWDGTDRWTIIPESLAVSDAGTRDMEVPLFRDENAYVADGVLVAQFDGGQYPTPAPGAPTILRPVSQIVLTGRLVRSKDAGGAGWQLLDVRAGSRSPVSTMLAAWTRSPAPPRTVGPPVCADPVSYLQYKQSICAFVDIASRPGSAPTAPCDAISAGLIVVTAPAQLGGIGAPVGEPPPCAPGIVPETDTCN